MKICSQCNKLKEYKQFHKKSAAPDGLQYKCKECVKEINAKFREDKPMYQLNWFKKNTKKWYDYTWAYRKADKTPIIYAVVNPDNQIYIGMTTAFLNIRIVGHRTQYRRKRKTCPLLQDSFDKHGVENHKFLVLQEYPGLTRKELKQKETEWIQLYQQQGISLNIKK